MVRIALSYSFLKAGRIPRGNARITLEILFPDIFRLRSGTRMEFVSGHALQGLLDGGRFLYGREGTSMITLNVRYMYPANRHN